jgi:hypothetical protein
MRLFHHSLLPQSHPRTIKGLRLGASLCVRQAFRIDFSVLWMRTPPSNAPCHEGRRGEASERADRRGRQAPRPPRMGHGVVCSRSAHIQDITKCAYPERSTTRIDAVREVCLRPTFLKSPEHRNVLAQGTRQTRATRHMKMKRTIVHPELRSATVGRSCDTVLGEASHRSTVLTPWINCGPVLIHERYVIADVNVPARLTGHHRHAKGRLLLPKHRG